MSRLRLKFARGALRTRWIILISFLIVTISGVLAFWRYRELYPATDDAYARSGVLRVVADVSGPVTHVYVHNDEHVRKDDPLFDIDTTLYLAAVGKTRAQFEDALTAAGSAGDTLQKDAVQLEKEAEALNNALKAYRDATEAQGGDASAQLISTRKNWEDALERFRDTEGKFGKDSSEQLATTSTTVALLSAANELNRAVYNWLHTHVTAPASGSLSQLTLQSGALVRAGVPLFVIVKGDQWWVNANFKETDLSRIKVGQKAIIHFDMYPGLGFNGVVEGISEASGATFSMLPPENATGNWVKVTQRFPVQIRIVNPGQYKNKPLRVGASASVTVDTLSSKAMG
jgi:membrane fusion protein, multidrug efflux system